MHQTDTHTDRNEFGTLVQINPKTETSAYSAQQPANCRLRLTKLPREERLCRQKAEFQMDLLTISQLNRKPEDTLGLQGYCNTGNKW